MIERAVNGGAFSTLAAVAANATSFVDLAVVLDTTYDYRVYAFNATGPSPFSNVATVITAGPPAAPTLLTAVLQAGPQVLLNWTDNSATETSFVVERAVNGGAFATLVTLGANVTTYTDATVALDNTYDYRVYAFNGFGNSGFSNVASVVTPPLAPTGLNAVYQAAPRVRLTWIDNALSETSFQIERCTGTGCTNFAVIASAPARAGTGPTTFDDTAIAPSTTYRYRVAAVNAGGLSGYSNIATRATSAFPFDPSNVTVTAERVGTSNSDRLVVTWTDNSTNESGFRIQWSTSPTFPTGVFQAQVAPNATTYTTGNVSRFTNYYVRVQAFNMFGPSFYVNAAPFPVLTP